MTLRAVLFDLDGTLIDSAPSLHRAAAATMEALGHSAPTLAQVKGFAGDGIPALVERCLAAAGQPPTEEAVVVFRAIYDADPLTGTAPLPGARDLLSGLRDHGMALGLCTNKPEAPTRTIIEALRLGPFDAMACGDTLPRRKPDPAPLRHVLSLLGVGPEHAAYVGDGAADHAAAGAAEVRYLHVAGGYGSGTIPPDVSHYRDLGAVFGDLTRNGG